MNASKFYFSVLLLGTAIVVNFQHTNGKVNEKVPKIEHFQYEEKKLESYLQILNNKRLSGEQGVKDNNFAEGDAINNKQNMKKMSDVSGKHNFETEGEPSLTLRENTKSNRFDTRKDECKKTSSNIKSTTKFRALRNELCIQRCKRTCFGDYSGLSRYGKIAFSIEKCMASCVSECFKRLKKKTTLLFSKMVNTKETPINIDNVKIVNCKVENTNNRGKISSDDHILLSANDELVSCFENGSKRRTNCLNYCSHICKEILKDEKDSDLTKEYELSELFKHVTSINEMDVPHETEDSTYVVNENIREGPSFLYDYD
ncbi:hypothetical protein ACOME3_005334 [Neoechinorhynchus agilis]